MRAFVARLVTALLAAAAIFGCASLPEVHPWSAESGARTPTLVGSRGELSQKRAEAALARIRAKGGGSDVLERHIAIEEEVAGAPLTVGNAASLLYDGPASYQSMFDAIEKARDHINAEFYIVEDDEVGRAFADALIKKASQGLSVNLMYDSVGSNEAPLEFFDRLRKGGVKVLEYNPINPMRARGAWRINNRNHRKVLVVDGRTGFTGGINISDVYSSGSSPGGGSRRPRA